LRGAFGFLYPIAMDPKYTDKLLATTRPGATDASSNDPQTVLHAAYAAIIRGDFDSLAESMTDDVELNICGFPTIDGSWRGRNDVVAAARRNYAQIENQRPEIEAMISDGDSIAVLLRESGVLKPTRQAYSIRGVQWFTFAEGKIRKIDEIAASIWKVADLRRGEETLAPPPIRPLSPSPPPSFSPPTVSSSRWDSAFRPAAVRPPFLTGSGALAGVVLGATATGAGAAAAFAALTAAQRFFVAAIIARLAAALIFRFAGAVGPTVACSVESCSTDSSTAFRPGPGVFSVVARP
jgi:ketosteroid isomerase-like protein